MGYELGVDIGGTAVAAAVTTDSHVEMVDLGDRTVTVPAVVFLDDDGSLLAGQAAAARAVEHPDRVGRELTRRLGSPTPVRLGDTSFPPATLLGELLGDVVTRVAESVGSKPDRVALTHPAHWSAARREAFTHAIRGAGLPEVRAVTEPEAVAAHYAATGRLAEGDTVAVYSLGGSTFSAAVLRRTAAPAGTGIEVLGAPEGIERLGGGAFDEAILSHVNQATDVPLAGLDRRDPDHAAAVARLRQSCLLAKEALSTEQATTIPVRLPNRQAEVALTRVEFEQLIHTSIETTVGALLRALQSAQVEPRELTAVLLVGGSSRIPLVAKMITDALARPTVLDPEPTHAVALGAATLARATAENAAPAAPPADPAPEPVPSAAEPVPSAAEPGGAPQATPAPWDRPEVAPTAPAARTEAPERAVPYNRPAASPMSLFEPFTPATDTAAAPMPEPTAAAAAGSIMTAPPGPAPERSLPSFLAGDTTVIPTTDGPTPSSGAPSRSQPGRSTPARSTPDEQRSSPAGDPPEVAPPAPTGARPPRRRTLLVLVALVLVAVLAGVGYAVGNRTSPAPAPGTPTAPAGRPAPGVSVPVPAVAGTVQVGETPGFVVVSPDGQQVLVANQAAGVVTVVDTATDAVTARIPVPTGPPQYLAFSPDGRRVYVSIWDQARTVAAVGVLDTATNTFLATIPVRTRPYLSAVTPDGQQLYVPNHDSGTVSVIDTGTNTVTTEIKVAPNPHWVEMSADGTRAYTANHESNLVSVIDTANNSILAEVPVQTSPHSLAVHPSRPLVANVNYDAASVTMIDTTTDEVVATIPVGTNPQDISWAPDGQHAYVANTTDGTVSVIDGNTATVTATIPTGSSPTSVAVLPDGSAAYVNNLEEGTLSVLNIAG